MVGGYYCKYCSYFKRPSRLLPSHRPWESNPNLNEYQRLEMELLDVILYTEAFSLYINTIKIYCFFLFFKNNLTKNFIHIYK